MSKPYRITRQSPTDLDDSGDKAPSLEFDYTRGSKPGEASWPERHAGMKFGPGLIRRALASGLVVVATVDGFPYDVAVKEAQWIGQVLEVKTLEGWAVPSRLYTRTSLKGFTVGGILTHPDA